jgi:glycosyltransferase involved in cell wall biosynthesis
MANEQTKPKVSVLMAVYNNAAYLREAVDSILVQDFPDFELVIVDDGSTDESALILASFPDKRITILRNEANVGLTRSLNRGLAVCRGKYIARMDADDIAFPQRLGKQYGYLESNPDVVLLGSSMVAIGADTRFYPAILGDARIRATMLFENPFYHPTVMIRHAALQAGAIRYNEQRVNAQDYELWFRLAQEGRVENLPEPLLHYRMHAGQTNKASQLQHANAVRRLVFFEALGITATEIPEAYFGIYAGAGGLSRKEIAVLQRFFSVILAKNRQLHVVEEKTMRLVLVRQLLAAIHLSKAIPPTWRLLLRVQVIATALDLLPLLVMNKSG